MKDCVDTVAGPAHATTGYLVAPCVLHPLTQNGRLQRSLRASPEREHICPHSAGLDDVPVTRFEEAPEHIQVCRAHGWRKTHQLAVVCLAQPVSSV